MTPTSARRLHGGRRRLRGRFKLPPDQREALVKLDMPAIVKMGAHPLVPFLAQHADPAVASPALTRLRFGS